METADRGRLKDLVEKHGFLEVAKVLNELMNEVPNTHRENSNSGSGDAEEPRCSFCGKRRSQVDNRIIGGPGVFICIECVNLCNRIKAEQWPDMQ